MSTTNTTASTRMAVVHQAVHNTPQMKALKDKIKRLLKTNRIEGDFDVTVTLRNIRPLP